MASFLDELKHRLKSGKANAELKIITAGAPMEVIKAQSGKIPTMQIVGCVIGGAIIVLLVVTLILFLNNQREKDENLNLISTLEHAEKMKVAVEDLKTTTEQEMATNMEKAIRRVQPGENTENVENVDPNFTLLKDLR